MKKWLCLLLAALMLVLCVGCGAKGADTNQPAKTLTKDDAIAAAEAYWNVKSGDRDPETDALLSVVITVFPDDNNPYYTAVLRQMATDGLEDPQQGDEIAAQITVLGTVRVHQVTGEVTAADKN